LRHPGFACVEILELCPTFATARGGITGKDLRAMPADRGLPLGILKQDATRPSFPQFDPDARSRSGGEASSPAGVFDEEEGVVPNPAWGGLDSPVRVLLAGRAGERVQSSAQLAAAAACAAGLSVTLRTDNPVTQGSGFSLAELRIGPGVEPMEDRGRAGDDPGPDYDLISVLAPEGQAELASRGLLPRLQGPAAARWVLDSDLPVSDPEAAGERRSLRSTYGPRNAALAVLIEESVRAGWWAPRAWWAAVDRLAGSRKAEAAGILHRIV
ncbi:MAG TPA: hypothetical protein VFP98_06480, partial [Candidatus Polarisedimenticolia bacterium]|nr:hypothetical protein [Candidatus Polarisedimenticolia bacterium]